MHSPSISTTTARALITKNLTVRHLFVINAEFFFNFSHLPVVQPDDAQIDNRFALGRHVETKGKPNRLNNLRSPTGRTRLSTKVMNIQKKISPKVSRRVLQPVGISDSRHGPPYAGETRRMDSRKARPPSVWHLGSNRLTTRMVTNPAARPKDAGRGRIDPGTMAHARLLSPSQGRLSNFDVERCSRAATEQADDHARQRAGPLSPASRRCRAPAPGRSPPRPARRPQAPGRGCPPASARPRRRARRHHQQQELGDHQPARGGRVGVDHLVVQVVDSALAIVSSRPSAVDSAAARPPAATSPRSRKASLRSPAWPAR